MFAHRPRWRKVISDLGGSKTRTLLVVLSIAVGVFAVGMVVNTYLTLIVAANEGYASIRPASGFLSVADFDNDLVETVTALPEVEAAEGRRVQTVRLQLRGRWYSSQLSGLEFDNNRINLIEPIAGAPAPGEGELLIDQTTLFLSDFDIGETVTVEMTDGRRYEMTIAGQVRDMNSNPSINSGGINAYVTLETFEQLGEADTFNQLTFLVAENETDFDHVTGIMEIVKERVEDAGYFVFGTFVLAEPGVNPVNFLIEAIRIVLGVMAFVSLALSAFLVFNTMSALVASQVKQIGIMKSIGARSADLLFMYLILVVIFGLLAFVIAVGPAALAAQAFAEFMAGPALLDLRLPPFEVPPLVIVLELAVSILAPVLGALPAVIGGTRITVHEAISTQGLGGDNFGNNLLDRFVARLSALTGPLRLAVGNVLRNKRRVVLTMSTMVLAGAVFVGVVSVRASADETVADLAEAFRFDIEVTFAQPYRIEQIERIALQVPGVEAVEGWTTVIGTILVGDDQEGNGMRLNAAPPDSELARPKIVDGRWLQPDDTDAIVIDTSYLRENPDAAVGDVIRLRIEGRETDWRVVGIYQLPGVNFIYEAYANYPAVADVLRESGRTRRVQLVTDRHDRAFQEAVSLQLNEAFRQTDIDVQNIETSGALRAIVEQQFNIVIVVLLAMSVLMMLVGGLGLAGTMSMSVLERTREIGVMRAVGAADNAITRIVIVEGVVLALLSWSAAIVLGWPVGVILSDQVGRQLVNGPLSYVYAFSGIWLWLILVTAIAFVASYAPAYRAAQLTVRDVLAYE